MIAPFLRILRKGENLYLDNRFKNVPVHVIRMVEEQTNTSQKEKDEILLDLEQQYIKSNNRQKEHESLLKEDDDYKRFHDMLNSKLR